MSNQTDTLLNMPGPGDAVPIIELPEPQATTPASQIDPTLPVYGNPTTQSVRQNFATAQVEITGLMQQTQGAPFLPIAGGHMRGPMYLYNDPTDAMMPATKGYVDAGGSGGGGGMPEAPADGKTYGRTEGAWVPVLPLSGTAANAMTGELLLVGNPTDPLGATPKQYVDTISATATGAVQRAGDTMTGLLVLSGDPTAPLGAVTKQYTDTADNLRAPLASPSFTGIVNAALRTILSGPSGPSLVFVDTTASRPVFGIWNNNSVLGLSLASPTTGAPTGSILAQMDQSGNWTFNGRVNAASGRIISSASSNPSVTLNNTTSGTNIMGMWNNGSLNFGICDPTGAPQSSVAMIDGAGNIYGGSVTTRGGFIFGSGWTMSGVSGNVNIDNGSSGDLQTINLRALGVHCSHNIISDSGWFNGPGWTLNGTGGNVNLDNGNSGNLSGITLRANNFNFGGGAFIGVASISANSILLSNPLGINYSAIDTNWIAFQWDGNFGHLSVYVNGGYNFAIPPSSSDPRLKRNVAAPTVDALATINDVTLQQFDMQWPKVAQPEGSDAPVPEPPIVHWDVGFMSDQLQELIPESVLPAMRDDQFDTINQLPLLAYAFGAIQQLTARLEALEGKRR